jgi:electron transfer flavoprotein alpha subunit
MFQHYEPSIVIMSTNSTTRDMAARLAARLKTGLVTDCNLLEFSEKGEFEVTRPAYGGKVSATIRFSSNVLKLVLVPPGVIEINKKTIVKPVEVIAAETGKIEIPNTKHVGLSKASPETIDITESEIIVSGGRGLATNEGFVQLKEFAKMLDASVGGTRLAVDNGWVLFENQIGQTGKTVNPKLFITLGTSGAIHHTAGVKDSEFIMAVDKNPKAPIFDIADVGIVCDLQKLLPILNNLLKKYKLTYTSDRTVTK